MNVLNVFSAFLVLNSHYDSIRRKTARTLLIKDYANSLTNICLICITCCWFVDTLFYLQQLFQVYYESNANISNTSRQTLNQFPRKYFFSKFFKIMRPLLFILMQFSFLLKKFSTTF